MGAGRRVGGGRSAAAARSARAWRRQDHARSQLSWRLCSPSTASVADWCVMAAFATSAALLQQTARPRLWGGWRHPLTFSHSLCPLTPLPACRAADTSQHVRLRCGTAAGWRDHCGRGHHQHWCILGCGRWLPWLFPHLPANWRINWQWPARRRWCRTRCSRPTCHQSSGRRQRNVHVPGTYVTTTACAPPGVC